MEENLKKYIDKLNIIRILALLLAIPIVNFFVNIFSIASIVLLILSIRLLVKLKDMDFPKPDNIKFGLILAIICSVLNIASSVISVISFQHNFFAPNYQDDYYKILETLSKVIYPLTSLSRLGIITTAVLLHIEHKAIVNMTYERIVQNDSLNERDKQDNILEKSTNSGSMQLVEFPMNNSEILPPEEFVYTNKLKNIRVLYIISAILNFITPFGIILGYTIPIAVGFWIIYIAVHAVLFYYTAQDKYLSRTVFFTIGAIAFGLMYTLSNPTAIPYGGIRFPDSAPYVELAMLLIPLLVYLIICFAIVTYHVLVVAAILACVVLQIINAVNIKKHYILKQKKIFLNKRLTRKKGQKII